MQNVYLNQVVAGTQHVEESLRSRSAVACAPAALSEDSAATPMGAPPAVDVRVTGWWRWKTVVVPPNAFVVHTRQGVDEPLHCGLGTSFGFNPYSDAYLVVPAASMSSRAFHWPRIEFSSGPG